MLDAEPPPGLQNMVPWAQGGTASDLQDEASPMAAEQDRFEASFPKNSEVSRPAAALPASPAAAGHHPERSSFGPGMVPILELLRHIANVGEEEDRLTGTDKAARNALRTLLAQIPGIAQSNVSLPEVCAAARQTITSTLREAPQDFLARNNYQQLGSTKTTKTKEAAAAERVWPKVKIEYEPSSSEERPSSAAHRLHDSLFAPPSRAASQNGMGQSRHSSAADAVAAAEVAAAEAPSRDPSPEDAGIASEGSVLDADGIEVEIVSEAKALAALRTLLKYIIDVGSELHRAGLEELCQSEAELMDLYRAILEKGMATETVLCYEVTMGHLGLPTDWFCLVDEPPSKESLSLAQVSCKARDV